MFRREPVTNREHGQFVMFGHILEIRVLATQIRRVYTCSCFILTSVLIAIPILHREYVDGFPYSHHRQV